MAKLFHGAVDLCDPDANAEQVIQADDQPLRATWVQAARHATELDAIIGTLRCATELAGVNLKDEAMKVALVIDAWARIAAASGKRGAAKMAGPSDGGQSPRQAW